MDLGKEGPRNTRISMKCHTGRLKSYLLVSHKKHRKKVHKLEVALDLAAISKDKVTGG